MTPPHAPARPSLAAPLFIQGLRDVADRYDAFILDLWGCVHNGVKPFPGVPGALSRLNGAGKRVLMLSNAPRRASIVVEQLGQMFGNGGSLYDAVLTSGEVTWQAFKRRDDSEHARLGTRCLHLGMERDLGLFEGNGLTRVIDLLDAELVLATGPNDDEHDVAQHEELLRAARARDLPLVCANPDLEVIRGETRLVCAGALAARYEELGGQVIYHGKPHAAAYRIALGMLGQSERQRVLCIGDGLRTDILGANRAGLHSAFIPGGIHDAELGIRMGETPAPERVTSLLARVGGSPTYVLPELRW